MDANKTNFEPENEVRRKGGFRDESSHSYVVKMDKYLFLFPEEEFDKLGSIDGNIIWDTLDYVMANGITNSNRKDDKNWDEYTFDMYDLIAISHTIFLPPLILKVCISNDDCVSGREYDSVLDGIAYHVREEVLHKAGTYRVYINLDIYNSLNEDTKDSIIDKFGYVAWSGCDKHNWVIDTQMDLTNFLNIFIINEIPNYRRKNVIEEVKHRGGFRDSQTGEYILESFPYVFVLPNWFEDLEDSCRDNIYVICNQIATDPNQPKSNSTRSFTYKWDDIMACIDKCSFTQRKQYNGPGAMEQLMEREKQESQPIFRTNTSNEWVTFEWWNSPISSLRVNIKRNIWSSLQPSDQEFFKNTFNQMNEECLKINIEGHDSWNLKTAEAVNLFAINAKRDPVSLLSYRVLLDSTTHSDGTNTVITITVFNFVTCCSEIFEFVIFCSYDFFTEIVYSDTRYSIEQEARRIAMLPPGKRCMEFNLVGWNDCFKWYFVEYQFSPHKPERIIPAIPELERTDTMIGGFNGTTFYVTDNDEIVKENMYEDEVRGERCKILKFTAKRNGIYFFSIEMPAWNVLDAVIEDMLITKARIVSKIGCSAHLWHFNSVDAIEEFLNIPVVDEKNLLGLDITNPNPNTIKEENTMFNKFPFKKKNNDNLPKKEANSPAMPVPTPEQAKVIMDAMCACQADISQYAEDMRRDRARANATMARAILTHGIMTDISMMERNFLLPKDVRYPYATRMLDGELVVVTNGKSASDQVLDTTNSVPVTNLQDYANILGTLNIVKEQSDNDGLTAEEAASIVTNYIGCRDQALLNMLQDTNSLEKVIGEDTVKEIEKTEFSNPLITTSPTVLKYITVEPADENGKE